MSQYKKDSGDVLRDSILSDELKDEFYGKIPELVLKVCPDKTPSQQQQIIDYLKEKDIWNVIFDNEIIEDIGVEFQNELRSMKKVLAEEFIVKHPQGRPKGESDYTTERDIKLRKRAKELGYHSEMEYGNAKDIFNQLINEFDGLNTIDSIKNILNRK